MIIESGLCGNTVRKYRTMVNAGRISRVRVMNWMLGLDVCAIVGERIVDGTFDAR